MGAGLGSEEERGSGEPRGQLQNKVANLERQVLEAKRC